MLIDTDGVARHDHKSCFPCMSCNNTYILCGKLRCSQPSLGVIFSPKLPGK